jgi:hypothetical protein
MRRRRLRQPESRRVRNDEILTAIVDVQNEIAEPVAPPGVEQLLQAMSVDAPDRAPLSADNPAHQLASKTPIKPLT